MVQNPNNLDYLVYQRCYRDMEFFASYFFAHHCKCAYSRMHKDFFKDEVAPENRGRREAIAAPRANAKTTFKLLIKAIHAIVYGYESYILILAHSAPEATEKARGILEELEQNKRLIRVYGTLAPVRGKHKGVGRWGTRNFVTQNNVSVVSRSRGQQIRGTKHGAERPSLIICDDIESPEGVLSPEQRLKTRDWFYKDVLKVGQVDGSTNVTVIGTCLHQESLLSELLHSPGFKGARYQSIQSYAEREDLWQEWRNIYTDLANSNRREEAKAFFDSNQEVMLKGASVLWPEGEPYEYLMRLRVDEGIASFQSEKQNDPFDPERQLFDMSKARRFQTKIQNNHLESVHLIDQSKVIIHRSELVEIVAFHDPALGKKPGQNSESDYAAIVVVASDRNGYLYCLDAYIEKDPPSRQIEKAFQLNTKWKFDRLFLEDNHFQALLKGLYTEYNNKQTKNRIRVTGVTQHENKYKRISTLEPEITNGYLLFADTLNQRLIEQLTLFPTSYDDGPDALEGAVTQLKKRARYRRCTPVEGKGAVWTPPWKDYRPGTW
jgi:predicted phage terminase large subunit-like protein